MLQSIIFTVLLVILSMLLIRLWQCYTVKKMLLAASEERFSVIFESSLPLLMVSKSGDIILANQYAQKLFGYDQSQFIGMNVEMLMPVRFRQNHVMFRHDYMKNPVVRPMGKKQDLCILTSTGKELPVEISLTPVAMKNNFYLSDFMSFSSCAFDSCIIDSCVLCTIYDLSYQKEREEIIHTSEERYRYLYELINEGYCIIEMIFDADEKPIDWLYLEVNPAFEKQTGMQNVKGKKVSELIPTLEKKWFDVFGKVALTRESIKLEDYVAALHCWFEVYAFRFGPEKNKQVAILFNNITAQKEREQRLLEYGRNSVLLYKSIQIATEIKGIKNAMKNCLDFICEFLDFPIGHICFLRTKKQSVLESAHIWHLKDPEKFQTFKTVSEAMVFSEGIGLPGRILKTKKPAWIFDVSQDENFPRASFCHNIGIYSAYGFPLFSDGIVTGILEFFSYSSQGYNEKLLHTLEIMSEQLSHVFEHKRIHRELEQYVKKIELVNQKLDDFSYIISHDLKEPLRGIISFSNFLLEDYKSKLDDEGKEKLNMLINLSQRMHKLIDVLLEVSKISHVDFIIKPCDIGEVIEEKLKFLESFIKEKNADIKILKKMPVILCDKEYIGEVFQNLISNAIKYNDNDVKKIEISYEENGEFTIFSVKDNGIGIPAESYDNVFKIFRRLHSKDQYGGGSGMGMTILKQIVEKHEGKVWIDSTIGVGTTMYFSIYKKIGIKEFYDS